MGGSGRYPSASCALVLYLVFIDVEGSIASMSEGSRDFLLCYNCYVIFDS